ncbi:DUF4192 domain-containing protein [Arthrobacter monumenti]
MSKSAISVKSAADILAYVLHTLGFTPRESFVFITMHGGRVGATLRLDAPENIDPVQFAGTVTGYLGHDAGADGTLFIAYTDHTATGGNKPYSDHAHALETALEAAGTPIRDGWLVTGQSWRTYFCNGEDCCQGHPLDEITDSTLNAHMIYAGSNPERDAATAAPFTGDAANLGQISGHVTGWTVTDPTDWTAPVMAENRALWQETIGTDPDQDTALQLVAALHVPAVRDRIIADTINTDDDLEAYTATLIGAYKGKPDWRRVEATEQLAVDLLRHTPDEARAPLFAMLGWIHWYKGKGSTAHAWLSQALEAQPGHKLAALMLQLVGTGTLAECVKNQNTAYQR